MRFDEHLPNQLFFTFSLLVSKGKKVISLIQPEEKTKAYIKMAANVDTLLLLIVSVLVDLVDNDPIKF